MSVRIFHKLCLIVMIASLGAILAKREAPAQVTANLSTLRTAAVVFSPFPAPELFNAADIARVELFASDDHWPMPDDFKPWPMDSQGKPIITTRQVDELWQTLHRGQTSPSRLRDMFRGDLRRIISLNPDLDFSSLQADDRVLVWQRDTDAISRSVGAANGGRLIDAEPMPPGDNYVVLFPHRSFGTYYAISEIVRALDAYKIRYPDAAPLLIGDLSFRTGRRIQPHKSHQAGRDVDITYPRIREPSDYRRFHPISTRNLDLEKSLWLLKTFIDGGQVEYLFVDQRHQYALAREAKRQGAPAEWIRKVFQYPHHRGASLVRHARGHAKHFHVRFKCQETDRHCR